MNRNLMRYGELREVAAAIDEEPIPLDFDRALFLNLIDRLERAMQRIVVLEDRLSQLESRP